MKYCEIKIELYKLSISSFKKIKNVYVNEILLVLVKSRALVHNIYNLFPFFFLSGQISLKYLYNKILNLAISTFCTFEWMLFLKDFIEE